MSLRSKHKFIILAQVLLLLFFLFPVLSPHVCLADVSYQPLTDLPGGSAKSLGKFIQAVYQYGISAVGIVATIAMMYGGVLWITAGGNTSRASNAQAVIASALTGLVLALMSYTILYIINPNLVNLTEINPQPITFKQAPYGCCQFTATCRGETAQDSCVALKDSQGKAGVWKGTDLECVGNTCGNPTCCYIILGTKCTSVKPNLSKNECKLEMKPNTPITTKFEPNTKPCDCAYYKP